MDDLKKTGTDAAAKLIESSALGAALVFIVVALGLTLFYVIRAWLKDRASMNEVLSQRLSQGNELIAQAVKLANTTALEQKEGFQIVTHRIDTLAELSLPDEKQLLLYMKAIRDKEFD